MASFKATIFKDRMKEDKTWSVFLRFIHNTKVRYIKTSLVVTKKDLTSTFKIKNQKINDKCEDIIRVYRDRVADLNLDIRDMDIDAIVDYLKKMKEQGTSMSFTAYFTDVWINENKRIKGIKNYITAVRAYQRYLRKDNIIVTDLNSKKVADFCRSLEGKPRAASLYSSSIVRVFNDMREYYNDEENGQTAIKNTLANFKPPRQNVARQRALTVDEIRRIFAVKYDNRKVRGMLSRHDLALDCFKLSFCLMGMNSADLYTCTEFDGETLTYNRQKTKDRRNDGALMQVKVHKSLRPLMRKYKGKNTVFNFAERFSTPSDFNRALNIGLKAVGAEAGVEGLQFYAARHSFATIAVNDVGISIYLVNDMLCHVDASLKVTMLYVRKSFAPMNEANMKVVDYVLDKAE